MTNVYTYTSLNVQQNLPNIFQTEHFSAVKFAMGHEKNMSFLVILELAQFPVTAMLAKKKKRVTRSIMNSESILHDIYAKGSFLC